MISQAILSCQCTRRCLFLLLLLLAAAAMLCSFPWHRKIAEKYSRSILTVVNQLTTLQDKASRGPDDGLQSASSFAESYADVLHRQTAFKSTGRSHYLYEFNTSLQMPLLRVAKEEQLAADRAAAAARWLRDSVDVVFAATVRNAMRGLPSSADQMRRLASSFRSAAFVFVENDSADKTREFLADWRRSDRRVHLLGCGGGGGGENFTERCRMNVSYSTGKAHRQGWSQQRTKAERNERTTVMSALRNIYLRYVYRRLYRPEATSLLIVLDPDLTFRPWNIQAILQGLYYFRDRPRLQSLCAHTRHMGFIYDPCTLGIFRPKHFSSDATAEVSKQFQALRHSPTPVRGLPPVKMDSCFQAFTAYRLSHLAQHRLLYGQANGETICEHNTLSRQLEENYLDVNMGLELASQNEGGY